MLTVTSDLIKSNKQSNNKQSNNKQSNNNNQIIKYKKIQNQRIKTQIVIFFTRKEFILPANKRKGFRYDFHSSADEADVLEALATADIDYGSGLKVKT